MADDRITLRGSAAQASILASPSPSGPAPESRTALAGREEHIPDLVADGPPTFASRPHVQPSLGAGRAPGREALEEHDLEPLQMSVLRNGQHDDSLSETPSGQTGSGSGLELAGAAAFVRRVARSTDVRRLPSVAPSFHGVVQRLLPALKPMGVGMAVMIVDSIYAALSGAAFAWGPLRAFWVAAPLVALGLVKLVICLLT